MQTSLRALLIIGTALSSAEGACDLASTRICTDDAFQQGGSPCEIESTSRACLARAGCNDSDLPPRLCVASHQKDPPHTIQEKTSIEMPWLADRPAPEGYLTVTLRRLENESSFGLALTQDAEAWGAVVVSFVLPDSAAARVGVTAGDELVRLGPLLRTEDTKIESDLLPVLRRSRSLEAAFFRPEEPPKDEERAGAAREQNLCDFNPCFDLVTPCFGSSDLFICACPPQTTGRACQPADTKTVVDVEKVQHARIGSKRAPAAPFRVALVLSGQPRFLDGVGMASLRRQVRAAQRAPPGGHAFPLLPRMVTDNEPSPCPDAALPCSPQPPPTRYLIRSSTPTRPMYFFTPGRFRGCSPQCRFPHAPPPHAHPPPPAGGALRRWARPTAWPRGRGSAGATRAPRWRWSRTRWGGSWPCTGPWPSRPSPPARGPAGGAARPPAGGQQRGTRTCAATWPTSCTRWRGLGPSRRPTSAARASPTTLWSRPDSTPSSATSHPSPACPWAPTASTRRHVGGADPGAMSSCCAPCPIRRASWCLDASFKGWLATVDALFLFSLRPPAPPHPVPTPPPPGCNAAAAGAARRRWWAAFGAAQHGHHGERRCAAHQLKLAPRCGLVHGRQRVGPCRGYWVGFSCPARIYGCDPDVVSEWGFA